MINMSKLPPKTSLRGRKLLLAVKRAILDEPARLDMSIWTMEQREDDGGPACGTVACIAGWTAILAAPRDSRLLSSIRGVQFSALHAEDLLETEGKGAQQLFHPTLWPPPFRKRWYKLNELGAVEWKERQVKRAELVGEVIDDFIKREMSNG